MEGVRPYGLYRFRLASLNESRARVRFFTGDLSIPESLYRSQEFQPPFSSLPLVEDGGAAFDGWTEDEIAAQRSGVFYDCGANSVTPIALVASEGAEAQSEPRCSDESVQP